MRNNRVTKWGVIVGLILTACLLLAGCSGVSPEELAAFKTKAAIVTEMHNKCATDPAACCKGLEEAERALDTVILAIED
jgi:starvation-inducible outer membrane lipoprotein